MTGQIETQVVQALTGILALAITGAVTYLSGHAKAWLTTHVSAKTASVANDVVDGLGKIADSVVLDFNQRIVTDAKANGVWNLQLAQQVKADAVRSVLDQGAQLVNLGSKVVGNVPDLVAALVEQAVARNSVSTA